MYFFKCNFSKLEHIAPYNAKNETQSKQTSARTRACQLWVLNGGDLNFCVRSIPPRMAWPKHTDNA